MAAGTFTLAAQAIAGPNTALALTAIHDLDGMSAVTIEAALAYGSGGTTISAVIQTTIDGTNWRDIARLDFTTVDTVKACNLSGMASKGVLTLNTLASEGVNDGFLGGSLRAILSSTGTYINTTLSIRAAVR